MKLCDLGEKEIVRRLASFLDIGDDAAYIAHGKGFLLMSTDMMYEETHILPGMSYEQVGRFIVSVNASDIAAMGARPIAFLLACGNPPGMEYSDYEAMIRAADGQCRLYGMKFAGGDTKQAGKLTLSGFCVGYAEKPVLRSTAKPGDLVAVTGCLGDASLGADILLKGLTHPKAGPAIKKALEPSARVDAGLALGRYATAMTDISDSLAISLHDIAKMSGVAVKLYSEKIPLSDSSLSVAQGLGLDIMDYALYGGADYELLFSVRPEDFGKVGSKVDATVIGEVSFGCGVSCVAGKKEHVLENRGFEHFKKPAQKLNKRG